MSCNPTLNRVMLEVFQCPEGRVPMPEPPVVGLRPDLAYLQEDAVRKSELKQQEEAHAKAKEGGIGGFFKGVSNTLNAATSNALAGAEGGARREAAARDKRRFAALFPDYAADQWLCDFSCDVLAVDTLVSGSFIVTDKHLFFTSTSRTFILPLGKLASWKPAVVLESLEGPPIIMPSPSPNVYATGLHLYTTEGHAVYFCNVTSFIVQGSAVSGPLERKLKSPLYQLFSYIDHAWREHVEAVPIPGAPYASF